MDDLRAYLTMNRLRLGSGIIMFVFVTGHLINHSLGLISIEAMQAGTKVFITPWRTIPGSVLLYGAIVVHIGVVLYGFWLRRSFRLKPWEAIQLGFGLMIPPLLAAHVAANVILPLATDYKGTYLELLALFAVYTPVRGMFMALAIIIVWTHGCVGLHSWLRIQPWYPRWQPFAFAFALIVPVMALCGYLASSVRIREMASLPEGLQIDYSHVKPWMVDFVYDTEVWIIAIILGLVTFRVGKHIVDSRLNTMRLQYSPGDRNVPLLPNATLLDSIRAAGLAHASICGGRGRCTTCRVHIGEGLEHLPPMNDAEQRVLPRVTDSPAVRLACQIRPRANINVVALVPDDATPRAAHTKPGYEQGQEITVATLFVDLRGSTKLCEERLPFDVVFVLNQFFRELAKALKETNGHYAQFNGDGLMAIYGLEAGPEQGAAGAIAGAVAMFRRLHKLNERLKQELPEGLKIGVGIHTGEAIVGSMGPPASPIVSALGDNINIAARLESQTKEFGVPLVVSEATAKQSGIDFSRFKKHRVTVKGRARPLTVFAVHDPELLIFQENKAAAE